MSWIHLVLEVYEPDNGWPMIDGKTINRDELGEMLVDGKLGFGVDETPECVICLTPFYKIVWWKLKMWADKTWWWARYVVWDWWHPVNIDELFK